MMSSSSYSSDEDDNMSSSEHHHQQDEQQQQALENDNGFAWHIETENSVEEMIEDLRGRIEKKKEGVHVVVEFDPSQSRHDHDWWTNGSWIPFLRAIKELPQVDGIHLNEVYLDRNASAILVELFTRQRDNNNTIWKDVRLCQCWFENSDCAASIFTAAANHVEELTFDAADNDEGGFVDDVLWALGAELSNNSSPRLLRSLSVDLRFVHHMDQPSIAALNHFARGIGACESLKKIALAAFRLTANNNGDEHLLEAFADAFRQTKSPLQCVHLELCILGQQAAEDLFASLQHLDTLQRIFFYAAPCSGLQFRGLGPILQKSSLTSAHLAFLADTKPPAFARLDGKINIAYLMECFKTNTSVLTLNLDHNRLGDEDASLMVSMLLVNKTLRELRIQGNDITDEGATQFGLHLPRMKGLEHLCLHRNPITAKGTAALLRGIQDSTNMMWINLSATATHLDGNNNLKSQIQYYAMLNQGGRRLLMQSRKEGDSPSAALCFALNPAVWPLVLARANGNKWMSHKCSKAFNNASLEVVYYFIHGIVPVLARQDKHVSSTLDSGKIISSKKKQRLD